MGHPSFVRELEGEPVAILRGVQPAEAESICAALESAGVCIVEVPLNSPSPLESISLLSRSFGSWMLPEGLRS
jgi:2-dehydro-3-deoxyphosphogalactonate aldolase